MSLGDTVQQPTVKRQALDESNLKIGTHDGTFHCDEALACYMLKLLPKYKNAEIIRTRDPAKLNECHTVVDVGGEFNAATNRFDHHQRFYMLRRGFVETMNSLRPEKKWKTKLSSAGLIYCHFGEEVIRLMMKDADEKVLSVIYDMVYDNFMEEIDAIDNGVDQYDGEPRYKVTTNLSARVGHLNPDWNDEELDDYKQFLKAMELVGLEFTQKVMGYLNVWLPARCIVEQALKTRSQIDKSGQILKLENYCPWKEHLFRLEEENNMGSDIKYMLYPDQSKKWRIQCVPAGRNTFDNRLSLHSEWRGLRGDELCKTSGIPGCVFVHSSGFIGGNETCEGALEMARKSLNRT